MLIAESSKRQRGPLKYYQICGMMSGHTTCYHQLWRRFTNKIGVIALWLKGRQILCIATREARSTADGQSNCRRRLPRAYRQYIPGSVCRSGIYTGSFRGRRCRGDSPESRELARKRNSNIQSGHDY